MLLKLNPVPANPIANPSMNQPCYKPETRLYSPNPVANPTIDAMNLIRNPEAKS